MLVVKYTPPASAAESETLDITDYVIRAVWSGDAEQAARKLELEVAYNSPEKDKAFQNLDLRLGCKIEALYQDDYGQQAHIFSGRVFYRKRATDTYSFSIVAYDNMIYLKFVYFTTIQHHDEIFRLICIRSSLILENYRNS